MLVGDILEDKGFESNKKTSFKLGAFIKNKILKKYGIIKDKGMGLQKNNVEPIRQKENSVRNLLPNDESGNI